jgi:hypothetical protein
MKELNEKIVFVSHPKTHIELAPKREHENRRSKNTFKEITQK